MKLGKTTCPDSVSVELLKSDYRIVKITLLNEINDTGQIPLDISKSIFIGLPKILGATVCGLHGTIMESYHQNTFKNHHDASQKQNQTRNSKGIRMHAFP